MGKVKIAEIPRGQQQEITGELRHGGVQPGASKGSTVDRLVQRREKKDHDHTMGDARRQPENSGGVQNRKTRCGKNQQVTGQVKNARPIGQAAQSRQFAGRYQRECFFVGDLFFHLG
jgi:hypothetical protein